MKDEKFREALNLLIEDRGIEEEVMFLENHTFDKSIIGITEDGRLIYDYDKMVEEFAEDEECSELDAVEWLDYNTLRAIPYFGERKPIVIMSSREKILELYGED